MFIFLVYRYRLLLKYITDLNKPLKFDKSAGLLYIVFVCNII